MNIVFDRTEPRLTITGINPEANKVLVNIPELSEQLTPDNGKIELGNYHLKLTASVVAIKVETVTSEVPVLDPENGTEIGVETKTETAETVLESKQVQLNLL